MSRNSRKKLKDKMMDKVCSKKKNKKMLMEKIAKIWNNNKTTKKAILNRSPFTLMITANLSSQHSRTECTQGAVSLGNRVLLVVLLR